MKKKRRTVTLEQKLDIIKRSEEGATAVEIGRVLGFQATTVRTILKDKEKIKEFGRVATHLSAAHLSRNRSTILVEMERLLTLWYENEINKKQPVDLARFQRKALAIYGDLTKDKNNPEPFTASRGWFDRYKKRSNLRGVVKMSGEAASADSEAANIFIENFRAIVEEGGYLPQQIFNVDETGLFWKRMPTRTYISMEEKSIPGFKMAKDRMTLLLGGNSSGDFKVKPMLVYHSENPRALKGLSKHRLPVIWKANKKAWVTQKIFLEWFTDHFCPEVESYCKEKNLANKILLLLDNCPGHPPNLDDYVENVKVVYLPPNTTSLLQPMDQAVIKTFKCYYLRRTFTQAMTATEDESGLTLREFWKAYNVKNAIENIVHGWNEIRVSTLQKAWKKVLPDQIVGFEGFDDTAEAINNDIVKIARDLGLEVSGDDVEELLASHEEELSTEDLLQLEQRKSLEDEDAGEVAAVKQLTSKDISEALKHIECAMDIFRDRDPDFERSAKVCMAIESDMACYRQLCREKKKAATQKTLNDYFRSAANFPEPQPSTSSRNR